MINTRENFMNKLLYLKDAQIKDFIEKLYYAYRETFADPKKILNKHQEWDSVATLYENMFDKQIAFYYTKDNEVEQLVQIYKDLDLTKSVIS
jgi:hypothetical protein